MIDWQSAAIVIGGIALIGGPALWWVFFRMDRSPAAVPAMPEPVRRLSGEEIATIERELEVTLPAAYKRFLMCREEGCDVEIDAESVRDDARTVIDATLQYRAGFAGLPAWPAAWLYVGEEADACAYALDCASGVCLRLDKGHPLRAPLERHEDFDAFLRLRYANAAS